MGYLSIYRALMPPPPQPVKVVEGPDYAAILNAGPLVVPYQTMAHDPHAVGQFEIDYQARRFPAGSYILVAVRSQTQQAITGAGWNAALDRFSQVIALLDLAFPGIAYEKVFEGTAALPSEQLFVDWEQGMDVGLVHKYRHEDVCALLPARVQELQRVSDADRERFILASRWFRRGNDATNLIDQVLFYWMTLEVFPTVKGSDVVGAVVRILSDRVYPSVLELKDKLNIGRICGFRGDIIHDGKASIGTQEEFKIAKDHVERLRAIARTCLRLLLGDPPGSELDRYVLPPAPTP